MAGRSTGDHSAARPDTEEPVAGTAPRLPVLPASREIEPAKNQGIERGNRTRNNNSGCGKTKILKDVLSQK